MDTKQNSHNEEYAIVDLGSNSFHMIIVKKINDSLQIIYKTKQIIHLGAGLDQQNKLSQSSIDRAVACLAMFTERLSNIPIENIKVVGTYALRVAKNRLQFLRQASEVFPFPIEVISGQEEARLIYLGTINNESVSHSAVKFIMDIGGGSTEIAIGTDAIPTFVESRPMGCVTYAKRFFADKRITKQAFARARLSAEQQVEKMINTVKSKNISIAFGSSGTVKSIYTILIDIGVTDGIITKKRLDDLVSYILEFKHIDDIDYPSLSENRKSVFVSGLAIFYGVFNVFGLTELHYTQSAIREGILFEMTKINEDHIDICQKTINDLSIQYNVDKQHADHVVATARYFFGQWQKQSSINIDPILQSILYWSVSLLEIGLLINFSGVNKHSAYILQHSNMPGFNEEEQLLLSTLVRYHRKNLKLENMADFSLFETKQIYPLLQILRLSVLINNQRSEKINPLVFQLKIIVQQPFHIELAIESEFAKHNQLIMFDLEQEQQYWQQIKQWQLSITIQ